jgi:hypothetical protein
MSSIITLTNDEMNLVEWLNEKVKKNLKPVPNYTGLHAPDRFLIGYKGELAVYNYLKSIGVHNKLGLNWTVCADGNSQPSEITVKSNIRVEVKTSGKAYYTQLLVAEQQRMDFDYIFATRLLDESNVEVLGFLPKHEFLSMAETVTYRLRNKAVNFAQLRKPDTFMEYL